jgi:tight adherence protein B
VASLVACVLMELHELRYRRQLHQRVDVLSRRGADDSNAALFDLKLLAAQTAVSQGSQSWLQGFLCQADIVTPPRKFLAICAMLAMGLATLGLIFVRHWWIAALGSTIGVLAPFFFVHARRAKRTRERFRQLPDAFDCMARAIRAGQTVPMAFQLVAEEFSPPLSDDFWHCYEQQQLGLPYEASMRDLARRSPIMEMRILVVALLVQARPGGNLAEMFSSLAAMARKRIKAHQRLRALTGEGRLQANVLIVLPLIVLALLTVTSPGYARDLFSRPWLIAATFTSEAIGAVWIRYIVRPKF